MQSLFSIFDDKSWQFKMIERFIIIYYYIMDTHENVKEAERGIFCQKSSKLESIRPTVDALYLHVMRATLQTGIFWAKSCITI